MSNRIKILSPIDRVEEISPLIKAGADEFYCGVLMNNMSLGTNRVASLESSNLLNLTELEKLVVIVKKQRKNIFLVLNVPFDSMKNFSVIEKNISKIEKIAPSAIIVGNINLMNKLRNSRLDIIASSLLEAKNKETVRFLVEEFGVKKVILERQITLDDLDSIISEFPQIEFETFIMASGCRSLISSCKRRLVTDKKYLHIHLCTSSFLIDKKNKNRYLDLEDKKIIADRLKMPMPSCGACALFQFKEYPISSVKIVGRGFPTKNKIENVKFIRKALNILKKNYSQNKFYQKVEYLFREVFGRKCEKRYCYYPHFFR